MEEKKIKKESQRPDFIFKPSKEIRDLLKIKEEDYAGTHFFSNTEYPKDYFLYSLLDEIEKVGAAIIRYEELFQGDEVDLKDRMSRNILSSIRDEQSLWIRKLIECLAFAINFRKTNKDEYFKHFLLARELNDLKRKIFDDEKYFACNNRGLIGIKELIEKNIESIENGKDFEIKRCWYLDIKSKKIKTKDKIIELAIKNAKSKGEKLALGVSYYRSYGSISNDIHANLGDVDLALSMRKLKAAMGFMEVLSCNLLVQCRKLLNLRRKGWTHTLTELLKRTDIENGGFEKRFSPNINVEDFILVDRDLGEVIEVKESIYGYKSFKVKFYKNGAWTRCEDFFIPDGVKLFYKKEDLVKGVLKVIKEEGGLKNKPDKTKIDESIRNSIKELWFNCGYKELNQGRPDLAKLKFEKFKNSILLNNKTYKPTTTPQ